MYLIKSPVRYEPMGTMILDADNDHVLDIRGWGRLQYMKDGEAIQDSIGHFVAEAINEKNKLEDAVDRCDCEKPRLLPYMPMVGFKCQKCGKQSGAK